MGHEQSLRDLLAPMGIYRWEGSFQWGELKSEGAAMDQVQQELAHIQREMNLWTAQEEGLEAVLDLLGRMAGQEDPETLRQTAAALLRIRNNTATLAAMNDTLRGCGIPAQVEETDSPLQVKVIFPGIVDPPPDIIQIQELIEAILPCHLHVQYYFPDMP